MESIPDSEEPIDLSRAREQQSAGGMPITFATRYDGAKHSGGLQWGRAVSTVVWR